MKQAIITMTLMAILLVPVVSAQENQEPETKPIVQQLSEMLGNLAQIPNQIQSMFSGIAEIPHQLQNAFKGIGDTIAEIPKAINGFMSSLTGETMYCVENPYDSDCACEPNEIRQTYEGFVNKYYCENIELMFNPNDPDFQTNTWTYAQEKLNEEYPDCNLECDGDIIGGGVSYTIPGGTEDISRTTFYECKTAWTTPWAITFNLEDGLVRSIYCWETIKPEPGTATISISEPAGEMMPSIVVDVECNYGYDTVSDSVIHTVSDAPIDTDWAFYSISRLDYSENRWGYCEITDETYNQFTLTCVAECSGGGGGSYGVIIKGMSEKICFVGETGYSLDRKTCCDGFVAYCTSNGLWEKQGNWEQAYPDCFISVAPIGTIEFTDGSSGYCTGVTDMSAWD